MNDLLPVYQHPALTVLLDDNRSFLDSVAFCLGPRFAHTSFCDVHTALNWFHRERRYPAADTKNAIQVGYDEVSDCFGKRNASIDIEQIFRTVTDKQRFETPAVLVVDYAMPQMSGVEFCEAIRHLPCRKILLTGQADEEIAVDAFNRKLIDRFIRKNVPDAMSLLEKSIASLQREYFHLQTSTLTDLLSRHSFGFLGDPAIGALVRDICERYRFIEHYLFPNPDGILFFDSAGNATLMVIATRASLTTQLEIAQDQGAPPELLAALQEFRLVAFFSDTDGVYRQEIGNDWLPYCLPPQICHGREKYYWALFELPRSHLHGPLYSYAEFLRDFAD